LSDPTAYDWAKNERSIMTNQGQLELGLDGSRRLQHVVHKRSQPSRAQWWFGQMRRVVDRALEWQPAPPRPEQVWFTQTQRQVGA
jgi:hypothetical protein